MNDQSLFLQRIAKAIHDRNLTPSALFFLEVARPFAFLAAQFVWVAQPALGLLMPRQRLGQFASLLEEPKTIDILIEQLEQGPPA